ncbi:MAG: NAD-dependent DNA ligase LigA [Sphaerochaetaceae bacterium]|nr:NAD-dependent DNA ligase LigA [Sphaerochaetaceae bacterium]NLV84349.1 NAD-dependent DNA ligase LigA [Spirochaetales bacterium]
MDEREVRREMDRLVETLHAWQQAYYIEARPRVSDIEYDRAFDALVDLERRYPNLKRFDSPTQRVGSDLNSEFPEVRHSIAVLSLDKAYSADAIRQWIAKCEERGESDLSFVIEEKIDGVSMVLYYEKGVLIRAVTRGNGFVGNDVTANIRTIGSVPLRLSEPIDIAVRGEVYLERSDFERLNNTMEIPYANPRNLAAGTIRRNKSSEVAKIPLNMFVYEGFWDNLGQSYEGHVGMLGYLSHLGFRINPTMGVFAETRAVADLRVRNSHLDNIEIGSFEEIDQYIDSATRRRSSLAYDIDGLVVKVNELTIREELGYTGHHPRWAIAYKFEAPQALTVVKEIDVQVGRTGRLTPVARVESVQIGGSIVSNITLHNQEYVNMLELAIGDTVAISKRGDVIPAIERVVEKNTDGNSVWNMADRCPICDNEVVKKGAHSFCPNNDCPQQVLGRINFFVGRNQMDIEGLGPETIAAIVAKGWVADIYDLYRFDIDRLVGEPGFGEKKVAAIKKGLELSKCKPYRNVLVSLGIPEFGKKAVELLMNDGIRSIDELLAIVDASDKERLAGIKGFGDKTIAALFEYLSDAKMRNRITLLRESGLQFSEEVSMTPSEIEAIFTGQIWCVTGSFEHFAPRSLALAEIEARGGRTTGSVTGKTTHLLAGSNAGSKLDQALRFGTKIVDEQEFLRLLGRVK